MGRTAVNRFERTLSPIRLLRSLAAFAALAISLLLCAADADARLEGGVRFGGISAGVFTSPPADAAAPLVRAALDRPVAGQQTYPGSLGDLFNRPGFLAAFASGFLGAGLLGLLFGHGLFGGLGSVASFFGVIFQLALVVMLGRLIWTWWTGRNAPAFAGLSPRQQAEAYLRSRNELLPGIYPPQSADDPTTNGNTTSPGSVPGKTSSRSEPKG
jgi:predicted lipid-binding transport protein (Tim44 family)